MLKKELEQKIIRAVQKVYKVDLEKAVIEHPANEAFGDYASNAALELAKELKQRPMEIAEKLCYELNNNEHTFKINDKEHQIFQKIYVAPPGFINFVLSREWLSFVPQDIANKSDSYGSSNLGAGKTVLVEYSAPNANKPLHVGHSRNNFLGSALANILSTVGYSVIKSNYVGDIGIHICKSMLMYMKYGKDKTPQAEGIKADHFVGNYYILFEKESKKNPQLLDEAQELLRKWESKDPEVIALWKKMNSWVYAGWEETYKNENVAFDVWDYESENVEVGKEIVNIAVEKGIAEKQPDGSVIARLEKYGMPDKILLRSDGTSVYVTKDLQLALDGYTKYKYDKRLYVVDFRQGDYFKQLFTILKVLGFEWADNLHHISYGFITLPEGNMSSRTGLIVNADDVHTKIIELESLEVSKDVQNREKVIKDVALAAYRFAMLRYDVASDIVFDYSSVTRFDGETGPYIQYTHARASSILHKENTTKFDLPSFFTVSEHLPKELAVLKQLYKYQETVERAAENYAPNYVCNYLFELAQRYNSFYNDVPILKADTSEQKMTRLYITLAVKQVLKNGLALLGISAPDQM